MTFVLLVVWTGVEWKGKRLTFWFGVARVDNWGVGLLFLSVRFAVNEDCLPAGVTTSEDGAFGWVRTGLLERCRGSAELVPVPGYVGGDRGVEAFDPELALLDDLPAGNLDGCFELRGPG